MADNVVLNTGVGGATMATDDIAGVQHQRVKLEYGVDGVVTDVSDTNPLPIDDAGGSITVDGSVTADAGTGPWPVTDNGGSLTVDNAALSVVGGGVEATAIRVTLASDSTGLVSVDDNGGSLTVDNAALSVLADLHTADFDSGVGTDTTPAIGIAVAASGGAVAITGDVTNGLDVDVTRVSGTVTVDGSGVTQPISAASLPLPTGASTSANQTTSNGLLTTIDGDTSTIAAAIKAEDAVHGSGDSGVMSLVVRSDAGGALAGTDGDYSPLQVDASGALRVTGGGGGTEYTEDIATPAAIVGTATMMERDDALAAVTPIEGDWISLRGTAEGALWTQDFNSDAHLTAQTAIQTAVEIIDNAISGSEMQVDVVASLPAGTNAIGKLAANTGVDIGDVDVTSVIPGTGATSLGKAVDAVAGATDTGLAMVAVRDDALGALTPVEGDYVSLRTDANGALWTHDDALDVALAGSELQVDVVASLPAGTNNIGDIDVLSVIPGTGATDLGKAIDAVSGATDTGVVLLAVRDDALTTLTPVDGDYVPVRVSSTGALHVTGGGGGTEYTEDVATPNPIVGTASLMERDDALAALTPIEGDWVGMRSSAEGALWTQDFNSDAILAAAAAIQAAVELLDNTVGGTELQVDIVASLPAGANNIGDIDVLSVVPGAGATNLGKAEDAIHATGDTGVYILAVRDDALAAHSGTDGDYESLHTDANGALWTHDDVLEAALAGSELQVDVVASLPAGTNAIGKLAANSGVDIGDVDVLSLPAVVLGAGTAEIGKLAAGVANIGDVDVLTIAAGDNNIGNVDIVTMPNVTLAAGTNTNEVVGDVAHDAAAAGNPVMVGGVAQAVDDTAPPNRVSTEADATRIATDFDGAIFAHPHGPQVWSYHDDDVSAVTTDGTVHAAPGAGLALYVTDIVFSIGAATASSIFLEESTTKVLGPFYLEAIAGRGLALHFQTPKKITANTALLVTNTGSISFSCDITGFTAQG